MGLKDLNKKLQILSEQDIEVEGIPDEPDKEKIEGEDVGGIEGESTTAPITREEVIKDLDEIIRVSEDLRTKCESLASLLPKNSGTRKDLMQIAKNSMESFRILNIKKSKGIN